VLSYELSTVSDVCLYVDACIMRMGAGGAEGACEYNFQCENHVCVL